MLRVYIYGEAQRHAVVGASHFAPVTGRSTAPDDLEMGHQTQTWLAVSDDPAATVSGRYWFHREQQSPAAEASDPGFQDQLIAKLAELTGVSLFEGVRANAAP